VLFTCTCEENRQLLRVQDNGLGLSSAQQARLFGLFQRMHSHVEGTGIGLYMVKKIVENAGGTLSVESELGEGTTFTLSLPTQAGC
jgi:signal transduction histidine kinase